MILFYHGQYNISLGLLNRFHPFDGMKFCKVMKAVEVEASMDIVGPKSPVDREIVDEFLGELLRRLVVRKRYVLDALEIPLMRFLPFSVIDKRILLPMRWAVQGTIDAAFEALSGKNCWNLSGGFHHASRNSSEGFCIYNDVGIAYQEVLKASALEKDDRILIVDVDAHHGNGNAQTFIDNEKFVILDVFNDDIYRQGVFTKNRVDIPVPLKSGCSGNEYLKALDIALSKITDSFRIAFVIAGTDVLATDAIGGLSLSIDDVCTRDKMILDALKSRSIPAVFLGGGGYGRDSATAISKSLLGFHGIS